MKINRTTKRTIEILQLISKYPKGLELEEIMEELELPRTSAYDILVTLVETGMLELVKAGKIKYKVGLSLYSLGMSYKNNMDILKLMDKSLASFAKDIGKTVFYAVREGNEVVYIAKYEPENPIITTARVGGRNPLYCTSLGKAILANMSEDEFSEMNFVFDKKTKNTLISKKELYESFAEIKQRGYAFDDRELEEHMFCVGAPIFDDTNKVIGAISASSLYKKSEDYSSLGKQIGEKAKEISRILAYGY